MSHDTFFMSQYSPRHEEVDRFVNISLSDSEEEEEKQDHDYNYEREEYLNPVVIKLPDGTLNIGTESKDRLIVSALSRS